MKFFNPLILKIAVAVLISSGMLGCGEEGGHSLVKAIVVPNSKLSGLNPSIGNLVPSFSESITSYDLTVAPLVSSLEINLTISKGSSMKVNGVVADSGSPTTVPLSIGTNTIEIVVTASNGETTTYTITVTRPAPSTDASLISLVFSSGELSPVFSPSTLSYSMAMSDIPTAFTVTPTVNYEAASIRLKFNAGNYEDATSAQASHSLNPVAGANTVELEVTAEDGTTKSVYSVNLTYGICSAGYYSNGSNACVRVGLGYWSPANNNDRYNCTNKPLNSRYTSPTASQANCPWSCDNGYLSNGVSCVSSPTSYNVYCGDNEIAVGLYGRSGSIIDRLGMRCAVYNEDGTLGAVRNGPTHGGNGGGTFNYTGTDDCPAGSVMFEVDGNLAVFTGQERTGRIRFRCKDLTSGTLSSWRPSSGYWGSGIDRAAFNFSCGSGPNPFGEFINGIIIDDSAGGAYTGDTLGITCR